MSELIEATKTIDSINSRLDLATPLIKSAELLSEMARQFAELGDFKMAISLMETAGNTMETANKILEGK